MGLSRVKKLSFDNLKNDTKTVVERGEVKSTEVKASTVAPDEDHHLSIDAPVTQRPKRTKPAFKKQDFREIANAGQAKRSLAYLKSMSPVMSAVLANGEMDAVERAMLTKRMMQDTNMLAMSICEAVGADPFNPDTGWVMSQAMEMSAIQVANLERRAAMMGLTNVGYKDVINVVGILQGSIEDPYPFKHELPLSIRVRLSAMKSVMGITKELISAESVLSSPDLIPGFKFDQENIIKHAKNVMFDAVTDVVSKTEIKEGDEETKLILFQALLNHASRFYENAIASELDKIIEAVESSPNKKEMINHTTVDLQSVDQSFYNFFVPLVNIGIDSVENYIDGFNQQASNSALIKAKKRLGNSDF